MPPVCHDFLFKKAAKVRRLVKESELVSLGYRWKVTTNPKERKICRWGGPQKSPPQILCRTYRDRLPSLLKISPTPPLSLFFGHRVNVGPQAPVARACASFGRKDGLSGKIHAASSTDFLADLQYTNAYICTLCSSRSSLLLRLGLVSRRSTRGALTLSPGRTPRCVSAVAADVRHIAQTFSLKV